ncbi:MAG: YlmC/YmxH family sporulation protein [Ruminococcus sp.]|nr:YlmC/YmxH family sporulation protein [Ruminococcus sp.]
MRCRLNDIRHKEVISAVDGTRIGYVDDIIVDTKTACVVAFVIFGRFFFFGIFGKREDFIIPWEKITLIGEDAIIVSGIIENKEKKPQKRLFFWKN